MTVSTERTDSRAQRLRLKETHGKVEVLGHMRIHSHLEIGRGQKIMTQEDKYMYQRYLYEELD